MTSIFVLKHLFLYLGLALGSPQFSAAQEVKLDIKVFLEGAYNQDTRKMNTKLRDLGYLPGMKPKSFFGIAIPFFDPYDSDIVDNVKISDQSNVDYPKDAVDWVQVILKEVSTGNTVFKKTSILLADGTVDTEDVSSGILRRGKEYYILLHHRNHLPVQSAKIELTKQKLEYDFTKNNGLGEQKSIGNIKAMFAGNIHKVNSRKAVNMIDMQDVEQWRLVNGKNSSYFNEDVDLNGDVSVHDQSLILKNLDVTTSVKIHE